MRTALYRTTVVGTILAALAAGMCAMHAAVPQTTTPKKSTKNSSVTHSAATSNANATKSGITSSKTAGKTGSKTTKSSSRKSSKKVKGQAAPTPERINEIQTALAKSGSYGGVTSGKWDDSTVDAMKKFQLAHGLNPSGKLDAPSLQKLGLGSETAGVAAPTPPPNATANRLLSSRAQQDHPDNAPDNPDN